MNWIGLLGLAFTIWMFVDALRKRVDLFWYFVIWLLAPFGAIAYFVVVKSHDYDWRRLGSFGRAPSKDPEALRRAAARSPSARNKLALAESLLDREQYEEAAPIFREVLATDPEDRRALDGLANCDASTGQLERAAERYQQLLEVDNAHRDYGAVLDYAEVLFALDRRDEAVEMLEGLVRTSGRINHRLALAHFSRLAGDANRAREVLLDALDHYDASPDFVKKRDKRWVGQARQELARVERELAGPLDREG